MREGAFIGVFLPMPTWFLYHHPDITMVIELSQSNHSLSWLIPPYCHVFLSNHNFAVFPPFHLTNILCQSRRDSEDFPSQFFMEFHHIAIILSSVSSYSMHSCSKGWTDLENDRKMLQNEHLFVCAKLCEFTMKTVNAGKRWALFILLKKEF